MTKHMQAIVEVHNKPQISLNANQEVEGDGIAMRFQGQMERKTIDILIDSGSTHDFRCSIGQEP